MENDRSPVVLFPLLERKSILGYLCRRELYGFRINFKHLITPIEDPDLGSNKILSKELFLLSAT
jgi:hypothetical protein